MLVGEPDKIKSLCIQSEILRSSNFSNETINSVSNTNFYTGFNESLKVSTNTSNIGIFGKQLVIHDYLNVKSTTDNIQFNYNSNKDLPVLNLNENDIIMTNLINNKTNIELLSTYLKNIEYPFDSDEKISKYQNQEFKKILVSDLQIGKLDDSLTDYNSLYKNDLICYGNYNKATEFLPVQNENVISPLSYQVHKPLFKLTTIATQTLSESICAGAGISTGLTLCWSSSHSDIYDGSNLIDNLVYRPNNINGTIGWVNHNLDGTSGGSGGLPTNSGLNYTRFLDGSGKQEVIFKFDTPKIVKKNINISNI